MLKYFMLALLVTLPSNSFAQNTTIIQKPIICTTQSHMKEIIRANKLEIIMVSTSKEDTDVIKMILVNIDRNLMFIHVIKNSDIACIIDDMLAVESTLDILPKTKI